MSDWQTFGGVDWIVDNGELVITPSSDPEPGYESGELPYVYNDWPWHDCQDVFSVTIEDAYGAKCLRYLFSGCSSLAEIDVSGLDVSNTEYMDCMFWGCSSLRSLDLSTFDFSNVIDMTSMFRLCDALPSVLFANPDDFFEACALGAFSYSSTDLSSTNSDMERITALLGISDLEDGYSYNPTFFASTLVANVPFKTLEPMINDYLLSHPDADDPTSYLEALYAGVPYEDVFV